MIEKTAIRVRDALQCLSGRSWQDELELQDEIDDALLLADIQFAREERLSSTDIVDFFVEGLAVEVKVDMGLTHVTRQLHRYLGHDEIEGAVLVTTKSMHRGIARTLHGKPVWVIYLSPL